tara:strand:- start:3950 stop:4183 length:234 start_codon:yes stop_codon:yes gene_type:complete
MSRQEWLLYSFIQFHLLTGSTPYNRISNAQRRGLRQNTFFQPVHHPVSHLDIPHLLLVLTQKKIVVRSGAAPIFFKR